AEARQRHVSWKPSLGASRRRRWKKERGHRGWISSGWRRRGPSFPAGGAPQPYLRWTWICPKYRAGRLLSSVKHNACFHVMIFWLFD
ncbi:unnamed protein product, partial [Ectocarpus sp. 12 AP-2014]